MAFEKYETEMAWRQDNPNKIIQVCVACGEEIKLNTKYCPMHTTKEGREATQKENEMLK